MIGKVHRVQSSQGVMEEAGFAEKALKWHYVGTELHQCLHF